jgi:hypothetical protein
MAEKSETPDPPRTGKTWNLIETEKTFGIYADVFTVAKESETGIVTMSFYQSNSGSTEGATAGQRILLTGTRAQLISKLVITPKGVDALMEALQASKEEPAEETPATKKAVPKEGK